MTNIEAIHLLEYYKGKINIDEAIDLAIKALKRPRGEWLNVVKLTCQEYDGREYGECSICHKVRQVENYCPHCGADMQEYYNAQD